MINMDVTKAKKPVHITCPYCHKDLQYNGASIKSRKEGMIKKLEALKIRIGNAKSRTQKWQLMQKYDKTADELKELSEDLHMLSQLSELETLKIFKRNVKKVLPEDQYLKLIRDSEAEYIEENTFNYYDLAIQKYNNFSGC